VNVLEVNDRDVDRSGPPLVAACRIEWAKLANVVVELRIPLRELCGDRRAVVIELGLPRCLQRAAGRCALARYLRQQRKELAARSNRIGELLVPARVDEAAFDWPRNRRRWRGTASWTSESR
jgi:hypothetical protein